MSHSLAAADLPDERLCRLALERPFPGLELVPHGPEMPIHVSGFCLLLREKIPNAGTAPAELWEVPKAMQQTLPSMTFGIGEENVSQLES